MLKPLVNKFGPLPDSKNKFTGERRSPAFRDAFLVFPMKFLVDRFDCTYFSKSFQSTLI